MATMNPFDLLVDDDTEDPNQLASAQRSATPPSKKSPVPAAQPAKPAKLPSKPLPPAQAVRESKNENSRGRGSGRGFGRGRGGGGFNRDSANNENNSLGGRNGFPDRYNPTEEGEKGERRGYGGPAPRGSFRGPRRGGFSNGEAEEGERPRRTYERRSGTGRGSEIKREGGGRRNWGTPGDDISPDVEEPVAENEKNVAPEQQLAEDGVVEDNKEETVKEAEEKEPEDKEMTLKEYEKLVEEKRKMLARTEVRKAEVDEELENMQQLSSKKSNDEVFAKLGAEKDKRKEIADKEEKAKKSVTINEFLKPTEGERFFNPGGRGRGRGRGSRGGFNFNNGRGGFNFNNGSNRMNLAAPSIEDPGQFPSLSAK